MQRIFKYGDIQNASLTSDKELNILVYRNSSHVVIYGSPDFLPTLYVRCGQARYRALSGYESYKLHRKEIEGKCENSVWLSGFYSVFASPT